MTAGHMPASRPTIIYSKYIIKAMLQKVASKLCPVGQEHNQNGIKMSKANSSRTEFTVYVKRTLPVYLKRPDYESIGIISPHFGPDDFQEVRARLESQRSS